MGKEHALSTRVNLRNNLMFLGDYFQLGDMVNTTCRTMTDLHNALDQMQGLWRGTLGTRSWIIEGTCDNPHPWVQRSDGLFDLSQFNDEYLQRVQDWSIVHHNNGVICVLDLFDHYSMVNTERWNRHPLNPSNNIQRSFGLNESDKFNSFYSSTSNEFGDFVRRYVDKITKIVASGTILSSGNEMVDGNNSTRKSWHRFIGEVVRASNPAHNVYYAVNDLRDSFDIYNLNIVDIVLIHGGGFITCENETQWSGIIGHQTYKNHVANPLIVIDADGLFHCRTIENVAAWYRLHLKEWRKYRGKSIQYNSFATKCPWPNDMKDPNYNWQNYTVPMIRLLNECIVMPPL